MNQHSEIFDHCIDFKIAVCEGLTFVCADDLQVLNAEQINVQFQSCNAEQTGHHSVRVFE